jgi:hypothetical protein
MFRRLFTTLSALSLLLCVAVGVLWVRSHRVTDHVQWLSAGGDRPFDLYSMHGDLVLLRVDSFHLDDEPEPTRGLSWNSEELLPQSPMPIRHWWNNLGFDYADLSEDGLIGPEGFGAVAPHWALALVFSLAPPVWGLRRGVVRRRGRDTKCRTCGYDLRATPGRCPECRAAASGGSASVIWQR